MKTFAEQENIRRTIELLKSYQSPPVDYAEMIGAECVHYGKTFVWENEEDYLIQIAIEALKQIEEREENKPLSLEQLDNMIGEPVWDNYYLEYGILECLNHDTDTENEVEVEFTDYKNVYYSEDRFYKYKKESE